MLLGMLAAQTCFDLAAVGQTCCFDLAGVGGGATCTADFIFFLHKAHPQWNSDGMSIAKTLAAKLA